MLTQLKQFINRTKIGVKLFFQEERGDFGIGQIASIVAGIVIIGVIISVVTGSMEGWIGEVWGWIKELFNSAEVGRGPGG